MKTLFCNARLLDGNLNEERDMPVQEGMSILVHDGRIEKIGKDGSMAAEDAEIVDLQGRYLMPGLVNPHVHLASSGKPPKKNAKPINYKKLFDTVTAIKPAVRVFYRLQQGIARQYLMNGITTIRTVGGVLGLDGELRDAIKAGKTVGPRILASNTAISVPGGHFAGSLATEAGSPKEALKQLEKIHATHPDWIKLMITGGVMDSSEEGVPGAVLMSEEIAEAVCKRAHELGYKVAAHIECGDGVRMGLKAGVDTIEHGGLPDEEILGLFQEKKAALICTIMPALPYVLLPEEISHCGEVARKNSRIVVHNIIECAQQCLKNGIPVGIGTDGGCNFVTPSAMWREVHYFVKYMKVSPAFALHTATRVNAEIIGVGDETGTVEVGKSADFLITEQNPLQDLRALRAPRTVVFRGKIYDRPKVRFRKDVEGPLDTIL